MKKNMNIFKNFLVSFSIKGLPFIAMAFAMTFCSGRMYEPELPKKLMK